MIVGPITTTNVPVVYDNDTGGFGGPLDMGGPQIGIVAYSEPGDNLHVSINIEFGQPSTSYDVFLVGGPAHALATGFISIGTLLTNAVGSGAGVFTVPHATLVAHPFGPGYRNDHIDLLHAAGDLSRGVLTAGAINYFVCPGKETPGGQNIKMPAASLGTPGQGDPLGKVGEKDPLGGKKG